MRLFGSDRIAKMMDRMGLEEGEVSQHSMITKSIDRAQKKIEEDANKQFELGKAKINGIIVDEIASELVNFSKEGLNRRNITDGSGLNENYFLKVLEETITEKMTPA